MKLLLQTIGLFISQTILEVIIMALVAKLGVPYMDFNAGGESVIELLTGIAYYYSLSKVVIFILPYLVLMFLGKRVYQKISLIQLNLIISIILTVAFWFYFDNPIQEIYNPVLGTLLAGLFILFFRISIAKYDKRIIKSKAL